jgi:hypothetical protein
MNQEWVRSVIWLDYFKRVYNICVEIVRMRATSYKKLYLTAFRHWEYIPQDILHNIIVCLFIPFILCTSMESCKGK